MKYAPLPEDQDVDALEVESYAGPHHPTGLRKTGFFGNLKRCLQQLWLKAAIKPKCMFKLTKLCDSYLTTILMPVCEANMTAVTK